MKGGDSMDVKVNKQSNEKGNIMLITAIIILILTIIVASCISISGMQFDLSTLNRNTSNTYYLAKSAAEKQVDTINKSIETNLSYMVEQLGDKYIKQFSTITDKVSAATGGDGTLYEGLTYVDDKIKIKDTKIKQDLETAIYDYIKKNYITELVGNPIQYKVQSDRAEAGYETIITIQLKELAPLSTTEFLVVATAETKNSTGTYDKQTVEATLTINVPTDLPNQIHEKYQWAFNAPEVLNTPLTCFSDVVITSGELNVDGDMLVKGNKKATGTVTNGGNVEIVTSSMDPDESGGVIANKGGKIKVTGNLYCNSNVMVSDGWNNTGGRSNSSSISVTKDIIADSIAIVDDFYKDGDNQTPFASGGSGQVQNASIEINGNAMVENDVMIDRWVKNSNIKIDGIILGINNGSDTSDVAGVSGVDVIDPNKSSGVFSQGENSIITAANGIYVAGQPFITLAENTLPMRLYESVGEPFDGVASWEGYARFDGAEASNKNYLLDTSPFYSLIKREKIITNLTNTYAPAKISAKTASGTTGVTQDCSNTVFGMVQTEAEKFFFNGDSTKNFSNVGAIVSNYTNNENTLLTDAGINNFYKGDTSLNANAWAYNKDFGVSSPSKKMGVKGYMNAMRSVFYGTNLDSLAFNDVISSLPSTVKSWSYKDPILVVAGGNVNISDFYVDEGTGVEVAWPTIIINPTDTELVIHPNGKDTFNGVIISKGKVSITDDMTINGSVIIGGPGGASDRLSNMTGGSSGLKISGKVTIKKDSNMLLKVSSDNHIVYRQILDALKVTQYNGNTDLNNIFKQYASGTGKVKYTLGKVFLTDKSFLEVDTKDITVSITELYRTK